MDPHEPEQLSYWRTRRWWVLAGRASAGVYAGTALSFVATLVAARVLSPKGFGSLELAVVAVAGVSTLLDFSLEEAVIHHGSRALVAGDLGGLRGLVRMSIGVDLAIGVGVFGIVALTAPPFADLVSSGELSPSLIRLAALEAFVVTVNGTTGALLVVCGRPDLRAWASAVASAARLAGVVLAAALDGGALGMLAGLVAGSAVGTIAQLGWARRAGRRVWVGVEAARPPVPVGRVLRFGFQTSATTTLIALRLAAVSVLLGRAFGPAAVGVFTVAMFPVMVVDVASSPLRLLMIPEQATLAARGRPDVVWEGLVAHLKVSLAVGVPAAIVGWIVLPWMLPFLYGSSYDGAVDPARILIVAGLASLTVAWAKALPAALGHPEVRTAMSLAELVLTVGLVSLLYERGLTDVASAVSAVGVAVAVGWWLLARRMLAPVAGTREGA